MVIKKSIEKKSPESLREILVKGGGLWDAPHTYKFHIILVVTVARMGSIPRWTHVYPQGSRRVLTQNAIRHSKKKLYFATDGRAVKYEPTVVLLPTTEPTCAHVPHPGMSYCHTVYGSEFCLTTQVWKFIPAEVGKRIPGAPYFRTSTSTSKYQHLPKFRSVSSKLNI